MNNDAICIHARSFADIFHFGQSKRKLPSCFCHAISNCRSKIHIIDETSWGPHNDVVTQWDQLWSSEGLRDENGGFETVVKKAQDDSDSPVIVE